MAGQRSASLSPCRTLLYASSSHVDRLDDHVGDHTADPGTQPPVGRARPARAVEATSNRHTSASSTPTRLPREHQVGSGTPRHRGRGRRQLEVAHHGQHAQPDRRPRRGEDQQPLQQPDRAGPARDFPAPRSVAPRAASSRSPSSSRRETDARRTALAHGRVHVGPRRRRRRAPRCRRGPAAPAWPRGPRYGPRRSAAALRPRSRWSRLSGSGLSRESHAVTGQPVARPGPQPGGPLDGLHDGRDTGGLGHAVVERGDPLRREPADPGRGRSPRRAGRPRPRRRPSSRVRIAFFEATRRAISSRSSAIPCRGGR